MPVKARLIVNLAFIFLLAFEDKSGMLKIEKVKYQKIVMKKAIPKILSVIILVSFVSAVFCSLGLCSGMVKTANADEPVSMMQQPYSDSNGQDIPLSSSNQPNTSQNCSCCKCLDTVALLKIDHKNQTFDFAKAFPLFTILVNQISLASHLEVFDHSPPKIALNPTPVYILNRVLRL